MFCWNCGAKNPDDHKYCGQCGKMLARAGGGPADHSSSIEPRREAAKQTNPLIEEPRVVRETPVTPTPPKSETAPRIARDEPPRAQYSGPSVLGLGSPGDSGYLLEDDDHEERRSGRGVFALVILLVLVVLAWKQWSVISLHAREIAQRTGIAEPDKAVALPEPSRPKTPAPLPEPAVSPAEVKDPTVATAKPDADVATRRSAVALDKKASSDREEEAEVSSTKDEQAADRDASERETSADSAREVAASRADDGQVQLAQKYLQGKGVPQDCARGVSLLRYAARGTSARARIQLGALYATGHCVTQDRAMAYRWFAQAQDLDPNNGWIHRNLNNLWAGMNADERRRAEAGLDSRE